MMLGLSLADFTLFHVAISLVAILAGLVFFGAATRGRWLGLTNAVFLLFTILTSVTGFMFPPKPIGPPFIFGVISLAVLALALWALYGAKLHGRWRGTYFAAALVAQWLNMVVLVVQAFLKVPALNALAPLGNEPPLLAAQAALLALVAYAGWATIWRGQRAPAVAA